MKSKILKIVFIVGIVMISGVNLFNVQKSKTLSEMTLFELEAEAHTIGCETSYGSPLYYCIDWSVVSICTCATQHSKHTLSYCPDKLCN